MTLYLTRHGETEWNVQNKICGITDVELTDKGRAQAKELGEKLRDYKIDLIVSSPLKRALETARMVEWGRGVPIEVDRRLIEQDYGIYEGVDRGDQGFLDNKRCFAFRYPGGESMMDVAHRTYGLIEELGERYPEGNVLLVCHGGVCRVITTYFRDMTNEEFFRYSMGNCMLEEYELKCR